MPTATVAANTPFAFLFQIANRTRKEKYKLRTLKGVGYTINLALQVWKEGTGWSKVAL